MAYYEVTLWDSSATFDSATWSKYGKLDANNKKLTVSDRGLDMMLNYCFIIYQNSRKNIESISWPYQGEQCTIASGGNMWKNNNVKSVAKKQLSDKGKTLWVAHMFNKTGGPSVGYNNLIREINKMQLIGQTLVIRDPISLALNNAYYCRAMLIKRISPAK